MKIPKNTNKSSTSATDSKSTSGARPDTKAGDANAAATASATGAADAADVATDAISAANAELLADLQRTRADFENYRKQMDLQKSQAADFARQETVSKFLPLLDDMERAIAATPDLDPLAKNLEKTIKELGLEKINSAKGADFNPDLHDAVMMEDSGGDKEIISETLRSGYLYNGAVIRPAMVKVATA